MSCVRNMENEKLKKYPCIITDEIAGKIQLKCGEMEKDFYQALGVTPSVTIKITNISDCIMDIIIKRSEHYADKIISVSPKSEKVITISSVKKISARCCCSSGDSKCIGCFILIIHYSFCKPDKKCHKHYHCNLDDW